MNNDKLKICHIITRMIVGGAQENTLLSAIGQSENGHDVTLLTGPSPGPEGELLKKSILPENIKIIELNELIRPICPLTDIQAYIKLKKFLVKSKFDVVHTHSSKAGIIGRAAAWSAKVPYIVHTIHGQAFHKYGNPFSNFIFKTAEKWAAKRCHKIYAVAQAMIDQCIEAGIAAPEKYKVIYSGMDLKYFIQNKNEDKLKTELNIPENSPVIGTVARLFELKGYEYFIPAAKIIADRFPNVKYLIVGDGILKEKIEKQINSLGLSDNFIFAGLVPPDKVCDYIAVMNILIHLSLREGLPRAVVQALASGKPAIGFNLDGTPEVIINNKTGYLIEPKDIDGVANAALSLLNNNDKAVTMGENGRNLVLKRFDWKIMVDELLKDYHQGLKS